MAASAAPSPTISCRRWSKLLDRERPLDHIVIETSGLALPQPLIDAFNWPQVRPRVTVDGVVTVVDARAVADGRFAEDRGGDCAGAQRRSGGSTTTDPLSRAVRGPARRADLVVLNKCRSGRRRSAGAGRSVSWRPGRRARCGRCGRAVRCPPICCSASAVGERGRPRQPQVAPRIGNGSRRAARP